MRPLLTSTAVPPKQELHFHVKFKSVAYVHSVLLPVSVIQSLPGGSQRLANLHQGKPAAQAVQDALDADGHLKPAYLCAAHIVWHHVREGRQGLQPPHPASRPCPVPIPAAPPSSSLSGDDRARFARYRFLVKWLTLQYEHCTWESFETIMLLPGGADLILRYFWRRDHPPAGQDSRRGDKKLPEFDAGTLFLRGQRLYPYQAVGVNWLITNYQGARNVILGDEMGLGKTFEVRAKVFVCVFLVFGSQFRMSCSFFFKT